MNLDVMGYPRENRIDFLRKVVGEQISTSSGREKRLAVETKVLENENPPVYEFHLKSRLVRGRLERWNIVEEEFVESGSVMEHG